MAAGLWPSKSEAVVDVVVTCVLATAAIVTATLVTILMPASPAPLLWTVAAVQIAAGPLLVWRRRAPVAVAAALTATAIACRLVMLTVPEDVFVLQVSADLWTPSTMTAAIYVMALGEGRRAHWWPVWALTAILTLVAARPWDPSQSIVTNAVLHTAGPALLGLYLGARRRLLQALTERAERAEHERLLHAEQARQQERVRLAEEMHDLVTHRVNLMVLQAGALEVTAIDEATRAAAQQVRTTGCQALDELRDLVGVLRSPAQEPSIEAGIVPDVPSLVAASHAAGMPVTLVHDGDRTASPLVETTVRHIVRETLTNAGKHAPGASVGVQVRYSGTRLEVVVRNAAPRDQADPGLRAKLVAAGTGTGLIGLRRRVALMGGTLSAGVTPEGGFEVHATLPGRRQPARGQGGA